MLSHEMVREVMAAFNQEFDVWAADVQSEGVVDFWLKRLRQAGMTHENAQDLVAGFCAAWPERKATLHDICTWIRAELRPVGPDPVSKADHERRLAFLGSPECASIIKRIRKKVFGGTA